MTTVTNENDDFTEGKYAKFATTKNYTIVDKPIYGGKTQDEKTPVEADEVPVHLFDESRQFRATGRISEAIGIYQYGSGVDSTVKMGRVLDTHTPFRDGSFAGTVDVAADIYRDNLLNDDTDPNDDREGLYKLTGRQLREINYNSEDKRKAVPAVQTTATAINPTTPTTAVAMRGLSNSRSSAIKNDLCSVYLC